MTFICERCKNSDICKFKDDFMRIYNEYDEGKLPPGVDITGMCARHEER